MYVVGPLKRALQLHTMASYRLYDDIGSSVMDLSESLGLAFAIFGFVSTILSRLKKMSSVLHKNDNVPGFYVTL